MSEKMRERRVSERGWSGLRDLWEMGEKQPRSEQSNNGDKEMGMEEENS